MQKDSTPVSETLRYRIETESMDTVLTILAVICSIVGIAGCILPFLPGPPLNFIALLLMQWAGPATFSSRFLWIWGAIAVVVTLIDYLLPAWFAKRFGGSKQATTGSTVGLIVGMIFFPPFGLILGAFAGALIGELMHDKENLAKAFRVALSSFVAFVFGTGLKLAASLIMSWHVLRALF